MNISDLNHLELAKSENQIVGGVLKIDNPIVGGVLKVDNPIVVDPCKNPYSSKPDFNYYYKPDFNYYYKPQYKHTNIII